MKVNLLSHYDLDGATCEILLRKVLGDKFGSAKLTGYGKLNEHLKTMLNASDSLIITDLSIDETRWKLLLESNIKILIIDHHETSLDTLKDKIIPKRITTYISTKYCGAGLVMQYFNKKYKFSSSLKYLTKIVNDYDMWLLKEKNSKILNSFFWDYKKIPFVYNFKDGWNKEKFKAYLPLYDQKVIEIKDYLNNATKFEINDKYKALIITASQYISEVIEHFKDFDVYFIIQNEKKLAIRFKMDYGMLDIFNKVQNKFPEIIESIGCHKLAGGINLNEKSSEDDIMNIIEGIYEVLP